MIAFVLRSFSVTYSCSHLSLQFCRAGSTSLQCTFLCLSFQLFLPRPAEHPTRIIFHAGIQATAFASPTIKVALLMLFITESSLDMLTYRRPPNTYRRPRCACSLRSRTVLFVLTNVLQNPLQRLAY